MILSSENNAHFSWNTSHISIICLQRWIKSGFIYRIATLASWSNLGCCLHCDGRLVHDSSGSLQQGTPYKTQSTAALLELVNGRHCAIVVMFLVLCILFTTHSLPSYITQIQRESAPLFIGLPPLSLSVVAAWWDLRTKSAQPIPDPAW